MNAHGESASSEREVERVARALLSQGAVREAVAMLRGAIARDAEEEGCRVLLEEIGGRADHGRVAPADRGERRSHGVLELDLALVDRWIRHGMLVEALALLGGAQPSGDPERQRTGREWANLLGELLAPVPVDAEPTLVETHRQLLRGGASLALTLLEERSRSEPPLPAWASRRLALLRWMLLDNASAAETAPELPEQAPSPLAGAIRGPLLTRRSLAQALTAATSYRSQHPHDADAGPTVESLEALVDEIERQGAGAQKDTRTMPMFGQPAAALQLRMGNLVPAARMYRRLLEDYPDDEEAARLLGHVEVVQRALAGEPVAPVPAATVPGGGWADEDDEEPTAVGFDARAAIEELDDVEALDDPSAAGWAQMSFDDETLDEAMPEEGGTAEVPYADETAEQLVARGRLAEAEDMYRRFAQLWPHERAHLERAEELRAIRLRGGGGEAAVLVRVILPVE